MGLQMGLRLMRRNYIGVLDQLTSQTTSTSPWRKTTCLVKSQPVIMKHSSMTYQTYEGTKQQPYPLTRAETVAFLEDRLGIEHPLECFKEDPENLLNRIAECIKKKVPFTTGHLFARPLNEVSDIIGKYHILSGHGGSCGTINPFTSALLQNIGYKTKALNGFDPILGYVVHVTTVVCDVTFPGSRHLVEPGARPPLLRAIPLDFVAESPIYKCHHMYNKFFKRDGRLLWCARAPQKALASLSKHHRVMTDANGDDWQVWIIYLLEEPNARVVFNQYWQQFSRGEKRMSKGVDIFVFTGFQKDKFVIVAGSPEKLMFSSFDADGAAEKFEMTARELKSFFEKTFSENLLDKIIKANYKYCT
ncbi:hypothetical protein BSL78_18800 [Apostichopus japonicus]|uniref:Arylamine N-acetyltransferase n=1 Tax=Stichopus japonicus TaxID=307972 RepID=A0A2G8K8L5_STIJA|nr:hypothetical protein BSL78_18800 [Apostichopus japonicus]